MPGSSVPSCVLYPLAHTLPTISLAQVPFLVLERGGRRPSAQSCCIRHTFSLLLDICFHCNIRSNISCICSCGISSPLSPHLKTSIPVSCFIASFSVSSSMYPSSKHLYCSTRLSSNFSSRCFPNPNLSRRTISGNPIMATSEISIASLAAFFLISSICALVRVYVLTLSFIPFARLCFRFIFFPLLTKCRSKKPSALLSPPCLLWILPASEEQSSS